MKDEPSVKPSELLTKLKSMSRSQILIAAAILLAVISIIISIACLCGISRTSSSIESIAEDVQTIKENYSELSTRISSLETTVDNTQSSLRQDAASKYLQITKQPSSVSTTLNRTDAMLFSVDVTSTATGLTFTWQIKDASGEWQEIIFDSDSLNTQYGLRIYNDTANGESQLWTKFLTQEGFGTYRCKISDTAGTFVYTDEVTVAQKAG